MVHKIPDYALKKWKMTCQKFYKKWLGLPITAESSTLYRSKKHFGLAFKDIAEVSKQLQVAKLHIIKYSKDLRLQRLYDFTLNDHKLNLNMCSSLRKFIPASNRQLPPILILENAERQLLFQRIKGNTQCSSAGLRVNTSITSTLNATAAHRKQITSILKTNNKEEILKEVFAKQHDIQTPWLELFDKAMREDLTWNRMLTGYSASLLKFLLNFQSNTLPSPDNLNHWKCYTSARCGLCGKEKATIAHIMNFCPWVRQQNFKGLQDRYTWRHNDVLIFLINNLFNFTKTHSTS